MSSKRIVRVYFAATAVFLALDLLLGLNVRVAFLDESPWMRAGYYLFCFACLGVTLRWPALTEIVGAFESLIALVALVVSFGARVTLGAAAAIDDPAALVTVPEVINFLLAGGVAWIGWAAFSARVLRRR
jgi:hypothetical protein